MGLIVAVVTFVLGSIVGGFGIYVGGQLVVGSGEFEHAFWTAIIGAVVWTLADVFVGGIPLVGPVLTFLAYLAVIKSRYDAGWVESGAIALVAWVAVLVVAAIATVTGLGFFNVIGVPGV